MLFVHPHPASAKRQTTHEKLYQPKFSVISYGENNSPTSNISF